MALLITHCPVRRPVSDVRGLMARNKPLKVDMATLKALLHYELPERHLYLLLVVDPKTGEARFTTSNGMRRGVVLRMLEGLKTDLMSLPRGKQRPPIHHRIPVITK